MPPHHAKGRCAVTKNHARKNAVRLRMAETGESFTEAARAVASTQNRAEGARQRRTKATTGCLFCGGPWEPGIVGKSDEHIWPQWIRKHVGALPASRFSHSHGLVLDPAGLGFAEIPAEMKTSKSSILSTKTREVCRNCNTGWMSRLEQRTEPLIVSLAAAAELNRAVTLTRDQVRLLAMWAQKTAITNEMTSDFPKVANTAMGQRLKQGDPLHVSQVWAARHPADYMLSTGLVHVLIGSTPRPVPGEPEDA